MKFDMIVSGLFVLFVSFDGKKLQKKNDRAEVFSIILMPDVQKSRCLNFMKNGGKTTFILERISSVKILESPQRKTVEKSN
jgi:hypothetical protein